MTTKKNREKEITSDPSPTTVQTHTIRTHSQRIGKSTFGSTGLKTVSNRLFDISKRIISLFKTILSQIYQKVDLPNDTLVNFT